MRYNPPVISEYGDQIPPEDMANLSFRRKLSKKSKANKVSSSKLYGYEGTFAVNVDVAANAAAVVNAYVYSNVAAVVLVALFPSNMLLGET